MAVPTVAGGLERVVEGLAVGHHRRGHDVTVAAIRLGGPPEHPFVESLTSSGVRVQVSHLDPRGYLRERRVVADLCRSVRPDVVHTHGFRTDLVDRGVAAGLGIPTVTTVHGPSRTAGLKSAFYEWAQRRNYRRFDAVVAVSRRLHTEALADGVPPDRLHCIPNAWSGLREPLPREAARRALDLRSADVVVGWVGRLIPVKGGDTFLEALSLLGEPRPIGVMVGYGPEAERLRQQTVELGLTSSVRFHEDVSDAGRLFAAFDTYVLSSRSEGLPIVILEAMAAGTPIVATRVGGVEEAVGDGEAWLVPPDRPESLAEAIATSLRERGEAAARSARATVRLATEFAPDTWLDRYERVYRGVARDGSN